LLKNGTTNFSTKQPAHTYKGITIDCDSIMEVCAVEHLVDKYGAISIERFKSILTYKADGKTRRFNPDFYVRTADARYIVEVKQVKRKAASRGAYDLYFPEKKQTLVDFCEARGFLPLWLDFDLDKEFEKKYRKKIYERAKNRRVPDALSGGKVEGE
jgi:hypothetical protein